MDMDFAIIGAQKSATTWLTYSLTECNKIYLPKDEIPIFENGCNDDKYVAGIVSMYERYGAGKIKGIKNTHLMFYEESPELIYKRFPAIKLIATLRNPVARAISSYFWHLRVGAIPLLDINEGMSRLLDLGRSSKNWQTIFEPGFYAKQIKRYVKYFSKEQLHFILYEEIRNDSLTVLSDLLQFLDLNPDELNVSNCAEHVRPKEAIYPLSRIKWINLRNPIVLYRSKDGRRILWKNINDEGWPKRIFNAFVVGTDRVILSKIIGNKKPKLSKSLEDEISRLYLEDIEELEMLIGKQVPAWRKNPI